MFGRKIEIETMIIIFYMSQSAKHGAGDARYVVWDPTGIIGDVSFTSEKVAIDHRDKMNKTYGWDFRIKKEFPKNEANILISEGCVPPGTNPTARYRILVLTQRDAHIEREIRILEKRREDIKHMIGELEKECSSR